MLRKFLDSKEHLNWRKIELNTVEIITIQDYKHAQNQCKWKYTYTVLNLRVKQVIYESKKKMPKPQDAPLRISLKIQQRVSDPGESTAGVRWYLPLRTKPKT